MKTYLLAVLLGVSCLATPLRADFQLNLTLGPQQQTIPDEVCFDLALNFEGDPGDYVDSFTFSLANNSLPLNFDYTRFSLRNLQNNFQGSGPFSNVGVAAVTLILPNTLPTGNTLTLGELVFDTSGLAAGAYEVTFNPIETDASGVLGGNINEFLQDVGGEVTSTLRIVNVTAVPEPASLIMFLGVVISGTSTRLRRCLARSLNRFRLLKA